MLLAFAGNSLLCRLALKGDLINATDFTSVRLLAAAITLLVLLFMTNKSVNISTLKPSRKQVIGSTMLFLYAWLFSLAYLILDTGSGALILFGFVQLTLLFCGFCINQKPGWSESLGMLLACIGLVYWLIPAWGTPSVIGFFMMAAAGVSWGLYTFVGRKSELPLLETSKNFIYSLPLVLLLNVFVFEPISWRGEGVVLAIISGSITSGLGYALWYAVLPKLKVYQAGVLQLLVPVIAALGGWLILGEMVDGRFLLSSCMILGGILLVLKTGQLKSKKNTKKTH